jgi:hypothetical protein
MSAVTFRPVRREVDLAGAASSVRLIPSGVISKAQASTSAMGKPTRAANTTALVITVGSNNAGTTVAETWMASHATTA